MTDFIIIGNTNAVTYKEVFPLFKANKVRLGYSTVKTFNTKDGTKDFGNVGWFSTFPVKKKTLTLTSTYDPDKYPVYDNYPAINVDRVKDIPCDYDGVMGVPITILNYDLDNVEIVGMASSAGYTESIVGLPLLEKGDARPHINNKNTFAGVLVKKNFEIVGCADADITPSGWKGMSNEFVELYYKQGNTGSYKEGNRLTHFVENGKTKVPYKRLLIKKNFEIVGFGGDELDKKVFEEYLNQGHKTHYGKSLLIYKKDNKWFMPFNRILILNKEKM